MADLGKPTLISMVYVTFQLKHVVKVDNGRWSQVADGRFGRA